MCSLALIIFVVSEKKAFEYFPIGPMLIYVLRWWPSWIFDRHKNRNLVKDIPMIFHLQFGFSQFISFREEISANQSILLALAAILNIRLERKTVSNFVEDHPRNIPAKFGSNRPSGFGEEAWNVKSLQTTYNRRRTPSDGNSSHGPLVQVN